ncbi:hydroxymethylglutaryl-CoA reductase [Runella sp.]|uniref:hydroxymethylglutaryl-CoA reductase n=1 Tax=Runella sp. TaxID=1960881 RepID=UPI003D0CCDAA
MSNEKLPLDKSNDYTSDMAQARRTFVTEKTGVSFHHIDKFSFEPPTAKGNIENFAGVAQVPIGFAGPLNVIGEHAQGDFYVPMATTEGTLVASYNRGMKLCREAGGITTTVMDDAMQRAPLFVFENARYSRTFGKWVDTHFAHLKTKAEETTSIGKLLDIEQYTVGKLHWLRFNYSTGDAAGQNMVTKATHRACHWILEQNIEGLEHFTMAANMDTDKKHSHLNTLQTRGKRVVAEITIPKELLERIMHVSSEALFKQRQYSNAGSMLSNAISNGSHFANGITAVFIATGQDVANVAESSAGIVYVELKSNGDYYFSLTIPSLIVATYGGGTGLPTQRECLEMMDCYGAGKVNKLAEIVAATVLCGELSLGAAIVANEWVSSHEQYGRNR